LPAAKAALLAEMQTTSSAAAAISIINLMARPPPNYRDLSSFGLYDSTEIAVADVAKSARSLPKNISVRCTTIASVVPVAVQGGYHL
jgi:hypothetical protein